MAEAPADLKAVIHEQADARVAMDVQGYAKYLTPDAIESLRGSFQGMPPRVSHYNIESVSESASDWVADVRYFSRDDGFVVRSKWGRKDEAWMVLHAERLWEEGQKRPGFFSKTMASLLGPLARMRRSK